MNGTPGTFIDGIIRKIGSAGGHGSECKGEAKNCTYDWFVGNDNAACGIKNNSGVIQRMSIAAPLAIQITSAFDAASLSGSLTVKVTLDSPISPASGTVNKFTLLLYERGVTSSYSGESIYYSQLVRRQLLLVDFTPTQAGEQATFTANFTLDPAWVVENVGALAFVQNYQGSSSTDPKKLIAGEVYNSGFLQNINAAPPATGHVRPLSKP